MVSRVVQSPATILMAHSTSQRLGLMDSNTATSNTTGPMGNVVTKATTYTTRGMVGGKTTGVMVV